MKTSQERADAVRDVLPTHGSRSHGRAARDTYTHMPARTQQPERRPRGTHADYTVQPEALKIVPVGSGPATCDGHHDRRRTSSLRPGFPRAARDRDSECVLSV